MFVREEKETERGTTVLIPLAVQRDGGHKSRKENPRRLNGQRGFCTAGLLVTVKPGTLLSEKASDPKEPEHLASPESIVSYCTYICPLCVEV